MRKITIEVSVEDANEIVKSLGSQFVGASTRRLLSSMRNSLSHNSSMEWLGEELSKLAVDTARLRSRIRELEAKNQMLRSGILEHLEATYILWDNSCIDHLECCNANFRDGDELDDPDDSLCDCGATAIVNGDAFFYPETLIPEQVPTAQQTKETKTREINCAHCGDDMATLSTFGKIVADSSGSCPCCQHALCQKCSGSWCQPHPW